MSECLDCSKDLTKDEVSDLENLCYECNINRLTKLLSNELKEARVTFEEIIRKILNEVDR